MKDKIGYIVGALLLIVFFTWVAFDYNKKINSMQEVSKNMFYMDTYIEVRIYTKEKKEAKKALEEVENIFSTYHKLTDRYNSYDSINNVYMINHNNLSDTTIKLDEKLYDLIQYGIDAYKKTNGLININLGNVIDVWKKYRDNKNGVPTISELKNSGSISISDVKLLDDFSIKNNHPNIDLGALAKGYTLEKASQYLESIGFDKYLINAGGNVIVGNHYSDDVYKIGIETPTEEGGIYDIVKCNNKAITTSGNYQRFYEYNGTLYHHIIDPKSLFPSNYMRSVTVITDDGALGDMLSTTLFLMNIDDGKEFLKQFDGVEAIWYTNDNKIVRTSGFSTYE